MALFALVVDTIIVMYHTTSTEKAAWKAQLSEILALIDDLTDEQLTTFINIMALFALAVDTIVFMYHTTPVWRKYGKYSISGTACTD